MKELIACEGNPDGYNIKDYYLNLKWQKPELIKFETKLQTDGCVDCNGGYSAEGVACSKGFQAEASCTKGAGHRGHVSPY